eukprot:m.123695 g.123695  ORF g.123695 m.123695 type:complete len:414 (+) comp29006_c0_seq1:31-1272(+)
MASVLLHQCRRAIPRALPQARASLSTKADLLETPVHASHIAFGGKMVDYAGFSMPVQYKSDASVVQGAESIIDSTLWTRSSASLFDVSHMCSLKWTGKDAAAFLEHVTVGDIAGLGVNSSTLSVISNEQGGAIDDTMITKCDDHIYQVINAGCATKDLAHFDTQLGLFGGDVNMEVNWSDKRGLFALQGPKSKDILQKLIGDQQDLTKISFGECFSVNVAGAPCFITRCGYTGEDGFEIYTGVDSAMLVWETLCGEEEVRLAGLGARDILRLEAGLCLYGQELTPTITPPEAGLSWTVGKSRQVEGAAPFIGSEYILAQLKDRKLIKRLRCGLVQPKGPPARQGAPIFREGEKIGEVTSGVKSPCLNQNISIAYIDKPFNKKNTQVETEIRKKFYDATTVGMPFMKTSYYKSE